MRSWLQVAQLVMSGSENQNSKTFLPPHSSIGI
jgi:hypothetical protein